MSSKAMALLRSSQRLPTPLIDSILHRSGASTRWFSQSCRMKATVGLDALDASKGDRERVVILGSGWAGYVLSQRLSAKYQTLVISPRSYFVFTPLLTSTATGTLEFRTALEPVRSRRKPNIEFIQGWADDVDFGRKMVTVEESVVDPHQGEAMVGDRREYHSSAELKSEKKGLRKEGKRWEVSYDKLVVTVGCYSQTFGIKGVKENAFFMKDVGDARRIRKRVLECFEIASLPTTSDKLRKCTFQSQCRQPFLSFEAINPGCKTDLGVENARQNKEATLTLKHAGEQLLCFAVVGGGPTGMEFAAELSDLVHQDLSKLYPALAPKVRIAVHDVADKVLSMFDDKLAKYAMETFRREGVDVKTSHHVQELRPGLPRTGSDENTDDIVDSQGCYTLTTKEDGEVGVGLCVWSTGNMMNPFVQKSLDKTYGFPSASASITDGKPPDELNTNDWMIEKHPRTGAIIVDDRLRVQLHSKSSSSEGKPASSATMTDVFAFGDNAIIREAQLPATAQTASQQALWLAKRLNKGDLDSQRFTFKNMGIMTYLGSNKGLVQTEGWLGDVSGRVAWLIWRGAYLTMSVSWRNKILIPVYWFLNWAWGRDITRF